MKRIALLFLIVFFCSCSASRHLIVWQSESQEEQTTELTDSTAVASEDVATQELLQFESDLDQADYTLQLGIEARSSGRYEAAQTYLDEVAQLLTEKDLDGVGDSLLVHRYNSLLESLSQEYLVVLAQVTDISLESPSWAVLDRLGQTVDETDVPTCGQWASALSQLSNQFDMEIVVNDRVEKSICFFLNQARRAFGQWLERSGRYMEMMRETLKKEGLPTDLVYLSMIESGFNPQAYSYAHAVGLWQFIKGTARLYDLDVSWWVDERRDPVKSTKAAAQYLKQLYRQFGDWKLAIAAYNCGEGRVERAIQQAGTDDFWKLNLPRQTENHVPAFMAAAIIAKNPEAFGFSNIAYEKPTSYDEVSVDHSLDLKVAARCAGVSAAELERLNPELTRRCTPKQKGGYALKIPEGTKSRFLDAVKKIPESEKVAWSHHKIRKGETLSKIARKYGVSLKSLMSANNIKNQNKIRAGRTIVIPTPYSSSKVASPTPAVSRSSSEESVAASKSQSPPVQQEKTIHTVRRGDTLYKIASRYGTTVTQIKKWNHLKSSTIHPGDKLAVASPPEKEESRLTKALLPSRAEADEVEVQKTYYKVRKNDTLWGIASKHSTTVARLQKWNGLGKKSKIHPGDRLVVGFRTKENFLDRASESEVASSESQEIVYTVKRGDTLWDIARSHNVTVEQLRHWNNLSLKSRIRPGDKFKIYTPS